MTNTVTAVPGIKTELRISDIINESIVDGSGIRMVIFAQGCLHHCPGCHNPGTHALSAGRLVDIHSILDSIKKNPLLDGVTLSGGEPFEQAAAFAELAREVQHLGLNIWTYTGYTYEYLHSLKAEHSEWGSLLEQTDILVDGPFKLEEKDLLLPFRGSKNQRIIDVPQSRRQGKVVLSCIS